MRRGRPRRRSDTAASPRRVGRLGVRPRNEAEGELTALYGLPIDLSGKQGGLATVAGALERGDAALAAVAAVLLGFPDPPGLAKDAPARGAVELAAQLFASGLLKDWDPAQHPRVGEKPNPGWFAAKPVDPNAPPAVPAKPSFVREGWRVAVGRRERSSRHSERNY